MKKSLKVIAGIAAAAGLGVAVVAAFAQPGPMGHGMGPGMRAMMGHGPAFGGPMGPGAAQQLMTPEERAALQEKMRNAKSPEERQKLAEATHAEMQKRAKEKGITLPGPHGGPFGMAPRAPAATDQTR